MIICLSDSASVPERWVSGSDQWDGLLPAVLAVGADETGDERTDVLGEQGIIQYKQGSYGSLKSMKVQDFLVVKIMYLNVLNFPETVEKSIKVHIKRV